MDNQRNNDQKLNTNNNINEIENNGLVLYIDGGSAGANPGPIGFGMHGYLYNYNKPKTPNKIPQTIATQKGYVNKNEKVKTIDDSLTIDEINKSESFYEVEIIKYIDNFNHLSVNGYSTNNVAELLAMEKAFETIMQLRPIYTIINSDSNYVIAGLTKYINTWKTNGWVSSVGKNVSNKEIWLRLDKARDKLKELNIKYKLNWVKGHNGNLGNEIADTLATIAANNTDMAMFGFNRQDYFEISGPDNYWKDDRNPHPFLMATKRVYWNPKHDLKNGIYYLSNLGDKQENIHIGKNVSDSGYAVIKLNEADDVINIVKDFQNKSIVTYDNNLDCIVVGSLDIMTSKKNYNNLLKYKDNYFKKPPIKRPDLYDYDNNLITEIMSPPYLSMRSLNDLNLLEGKLNDFLNNDLKTTITDVTNYFYDSKFKEDKKTKEKINIGLSLKSDIGMSVNSIKVPVEFVVDGKSVIKEINLTFGIDIPKRNVFKHIESFNPKVYISTEQLSGDLCKYECIIWLAKTGECGVWSASHSNTVFASITSD